MPVTAQCHDVVFTPIHPPQELSGELNTQARQVEALQQELGLMSSVAGQQTLQALSADTTQLQETVRTTREMLKHKKEQAEKTHRYSRRQYLIQICNVWDVLKQHCFLYGHAKCIVEWCYIE